MTNTTEMPEKILARYRIDHPTDEEWSLKRYYDSDAHYTRTDTIPKVTVIRQRKDGYWEALSDGSEIFKAYDEEIESDYMDKHPDHGSMVEEAWVQVPAGKWIGCHPDSSLEEFKEEFEEAGYQVFAIPSKAEVAREFMDAVEKRTRLGLLTVQDLRDVLKEWEDAESK